MNTKTIAWITGSLTLLMALFSFILSFNALTDLAAKHRVSIPPLFPLVVEAGVIIFSLNALYRSLHDESAKWQWGLIIGSSLLAGTFNVLHADNDLVSKTMAAMPSLFLLLSFETFLSQIRHAVKLSTIVKSIVQLTQELDTLLDTKQKELDAKSKEYDEMVSTRQKELDALTVRCEGLNVQIETLKSDRRALSLQQISPKVNDLNAARFAKKEQAMTALLDYLATNPDASLSQAGQAIGRSKTQVGNYVDELTATGKLRRNGQGWEVTS
jgi:hypothetical protein